MGGHGGLGGVKRNWGVGLALLLGLCVAGQVVQGQEGPPTITVTVNQSRVMRLEQKAKRVSVTQSEIAEVVVVAPNQILINGKTIGTTSLVVWDERGAITNFNLIVVADIGSLQRQLKTLFPEEKIDVSASGASIVLKGEVSNEVIYDKVLEVAQTYLPPAQAAAVAAPAGPSVSITSPSPVLPPTGTAFAGGGQIAFVEETNLTDVDSDGRLVVRFVPTPCLVADLEHWHHDTFRAKWRRPNPYIPDGWATFVLDRAGKAVELKVDAPNPDFDFTELELKRRN